MERKKLQKLSVTALIFSVLPLATFIPALLHITLTDSVRSIWAAINISAVFVDLILSVICVKSPASRSKINIISTILSGFFVLLTIGILALAMFINFAL